MQELIKEVVRQTVEELIQKRLINKNVYPYILEVVNKRLYPYFRTGKDDAIKRALIQLSDDSYIDVIYLHYRDMQTIERIAEYMDKDASTIKRNKKRLILKIFELMGE